MQMPIIIVIFISDRFEGRSFITKRKHNDNVEVKPVAQLKGALCGNHKVPGSSHVITDKKYMRTIPTKHQQQNVEDNHIERHKNGTSLSLLCLAKALFTPWVP